MSKSTAQLAAEYNASASDADVATWHAQYRKAEKAEQGNVAQYSWQEKDARAAASIKAASNWLIVSVVR
jgi:hypothetical protein